MSQQYCENGCEEGYFCVINEDEPLCLNLPGYRSNLPEPCSEVSRQCSICNQNLGAKPICYRCTPAYALVDDFCILPCNPECNSDQICYNQECLSCSKYSVPSRDHSYCILQCAQTELFDIKQARCCQCGQIVKHCKYCQSNDSCNQKCAQCEDNYVYDVNKNQCIPSEECSASNKLLSKNSQYCCSCNSILNCALCSDSLNTCESTCTQCQPGYILSNNACFSDIQCNIYTENKLQCGTCQSVANCQYCNDDNAAQCEICSEGLYYERFKGCFACQDQTYLPTINQHYCGYCRDKYNACQYCDNDNLHYCVQCQNEYILDKFSHTCQKCDSGNAPNESHTVCGPCPILVQYCSTCSDNDLTVCAACDSEHILGKERCLDCSTQISNCKQCAFSSDNSATVYCNVCNDAYYLVGTICMGCPQGCATCNSSSVCTSCKENYLLVQQQCLQCSIGCARCERSEDGNTLVCIQCSEHYNMIGNLCQRQTCKEILTKCKYCSGEFPNFSCHDTLYNSLLYCGIALLFVIIIALLVILCIRNKEISKKKFSNSSIGSLLGSSSIGKGSAQRTKRKVDIRGYLATNQEMNGIL